MDVVHRLVVASSGSARLTDHRDAIAATSPSTRHRSRAGGIRVPKTAETVANLIRRQIVRGELREGDALPLESEVMASLGVSRRSLREALRILEAENLISVMRGSRSGARVHLPGVESASRYAGLVLQTAGTTIADIYEARLAIEPYVVRRLAETRTDGAVQRLREEIVSLKLLVEQHRMRDFMIAVAGFHRLLVELGGMRTMLFLTRMLQDVVARYQVGLTAYEELPAAVHDKAALIGIGSFRKLVDLIEAGEGEKAEAHWQLHIVNANKAWLPPGYQDTVIDMLGEEPAWLDLQGQGAALDPLKAKP